MKLQLKFREDASDAERVKVIERLSSKGAAAVRPLFPNSDDRKRQSLYVVELNGASEKKTLGLLEKTDVVEFAEPAVRRKPAR